MGPADAETTTTKAVGVCANGHVHEWTYGTWAFAVMCPGCGAPCRKMAVRDG